MKKGSLVLLVFGCFQFLISQKVEYKNNTITVDKVPMAKISVEKENFGLTKNFNLLSMQGEKLAIAVLNTDYESDKSDNTTLYYRVTFLPTNQVGIFKLSSLGSEKGFANLIGNSKIVEANSLNYDKVNQLIASKGVTPKLAINYTLIARNKNWPIQLKSDKKIEQDGKEIGFFMANGAAKSNDFYEYYLPNGVLVAKLNFTGGNNAQNFELFTPKDNQTRIVSIPQKDVIKLSASEVDPNYFTLKRITQWLVENNYL